MATSTSSPSLLVESLKEYFECPICFNIPRGSPIYQCGTGHLICSDCRPKIQSCPICRSPLTQNSRLLFAERLLEERVPIPCAHAEFGCSVELVPNELKRHERECVYKPKLCTNHTRGCVKLLPFHLLPAHETICPVRVMQCPMTDCPDQVAVRLMQQHLLHKHRSVGTLSHFERNIVVALVVICVFSLFMNLFLLRGLLQ